MTENFKIEKGLVNRLTNITNRSISQTQFLFELCDYNFVKLVQLEQKIKNNNISYCPGDKKEINTILKMGDGSNYNRSKFTWLTCKPLCRLKSYPFLTGLISKELKGNNNFNSQWGVIWNNIELSNHLQNKGGLPNFWNDKSEFDICIVTIPGKNIHDEIQMWNKHINY